MQLRFTLALIATSCFAQAIFTGSRATGTINATTVVVAGVSNTQALLSYTAPDSGACTVEVSESATYAPLVHDVDPTLFTGADQDSGGATARLFVVGKRLTNTGLDAVNYSRALQAATRHYYRITCGATIYTGAFTTQNIPFGMTYQDTPQLDPSSPTHALMPTLSTTDRAQKIIDPKTGALLRRVNIDSDYVYYDGHSYGFDMYSGGFIRVCGDVPITSGSDTGYICGFRGIAYGTLYFLIPSTGEARYLGIAGWLTGGPVPNHDNKFYEVRSNNLIAYTYTGNYQNAAPGYNTPYTSATILTNITGAMQAFDAAFDPAYFTCSAGGGGGDYFALQCKRNGQESYGWMGVIKISTSSIIAATRVDSNIQSRWCGIHQSIGLYDQPAIVITTHDMYFNVLGEGPYQTTYAGGTILSAGATSMVVAGEPDCPACGADPAMALAQVGDVFQFPDTSEKIRITTKTDAEHWGIDRGVAGTTATTHADGATVKGTCSYTPIYWNYRDDPHGTDTTNATYVANANWPTGGHDDYDTDFRLTEANGWEWTAGDLMTNLAAGPTGSFSDSVNFAGVLGQCYGDGCKIHPSVAHGQSWFTDYAGWDGAYAGGDTLTHITGQLYRYNKGSNPLNPKHFSISANGPDAAGGFWDNFVDVSPAVLDTTSAGSYTFCVANAIDECYAGSTKGKVYVNLPGSPSNCNGNQSCITNFSAYAGAVVQVAKDGSKARVLTNGLVGLRDTNDYPTAKAVGSSVLTTVGDETYRLPSNIVMIQPPAFTVDDAVDRTTFIRAPISITTPGGLGIATATVEFGYLEQGTVAQHYCTSRRETCVVVSSTVTDATPFWYKTTDAASYSKASCASSCTITLPVLPEHVAYYTVKFYDAGGSFVQDGKSGYAIEGTVK